MTEAQFCAAIRKATAQGRMDVVSVVVPMRDGLPERRVFAAVLEQYQRPDVSVVVLHKAEVEPE